MKKNLNLSLSALVLAATLAALNYGCGNKPGSTVTPGGGTAPSVVSVEKTSFNDVTAKLDAGGNFYMYLGTEQWLDGLSARLGKFQQSLSSIPDVPPEQVANINKGFDLVVRLVKDSGIEDVSGVGMSSVEFEKGVYRNKMLLHHYAEKGTGFIWKLTGQGPHALNGLDFLPTDTALAAFGDLDVPLVWTTIQKEVGQADLPQAKAWMDKLPALFEQQTQVKWDAFLNSLGGEFGFVLTLDESNSIPVPLPSGALTVPTPGLMLVAKVNDDTIFNRIDQQLKAMPSIISVDKPGLKMRTMPVPLPFVGELRPSTATSGGYLFIASSDALIDEALAVKGGKAGLKATDEFKHLSQGLPDQGNSFCFLSERLGQVIMQAQQQAMAGQSGNSQKAQWLQSLFQSQPTFAYTVGVNTPEGCFSVGNGSQSYANMVLLPGVAAAGMMAAVAIPNFVKARETSQRNACINNLRQLDAAKNEWALEKGKKTGDVPTMDDLKPYLVRVPHCPAGGTYSINAVGQPPTCSIPGHELP